MEKKYGRLKQATRCRLCREKVGRVSYKDLHLFGKFLGRDGMIEARKRSGACAYHQRQLQRAIKHARYIGLLSYVGQ